MSNLCIITARGGSKRIPRKNIRSFLGKPIIAYSVEAALKSGVFDEVMVSTDDEEIRTVALQYGATVPFLRSEATSNDYATTADVLNEVLNEYENRGRTFAFFACVYPTAPFVTSEKLKAAMESIVSSDADSIRTVVQYSYPPQRAFVLRDGILTYQYPQYYRTRSQDLEPIYHDCGQFYIYRTASFRAFGDAGKMLPIVMPEEETQDIDNYSDWELA
ncbi:MAG: pseudaminic acid cytidylyltransferase, partial [Parasporobacterium sp.]|nr:pseudaminic acid cytidylyltransferase [Parasporobacterium sp.]